MKINKKIILTTLSVVVPTLVFCATSTERVISKHDAEKFFYKKGYKDGVSAGERKGYSRAMKDMKKNIKKWEKRIKAMEAGKYLSKKNKITAPQIYQVNDNGDIKIIVKGCEIKKALTPKEILMLPDYGSSSIPETYVYDLNEMPSNIGNTAISSEVSNSVYLPGIDRKQGRPTMSGSKRSSVYKLFPDTEYYRQVFRKLNYPFAIIGGDSIKVRFKSSREAVSFAKKYKMSAGVDVK